MRGFAGMRKIFIPICIVLGTLIYFLPFLASRGWAKGQLESHLAAQLGGEVKIKTLFLGWNQKQSCRHVTWIDKEKGISISADRVEILAGLIDCIRYKNTPLNVYVEGAEMKSNASLRFIKKKKKKHLEMKFSPISATLSKRIVTFQRTEIEINGSMKVFTSGEINLEKDQMDITLGLPQKALGKVFKEAKNLPENFVLEIPVATKLSAKAFEKVLLAFFLKNFGSIGKSE